MANIVKSIVRNDTSTIVEVNKLDGKSAVLKLVDKAGRRYFFDLAKIDVIRDAVGNPPITLDLFHNDGVQSDFTFSTPDLLEAVITIWLAHRYVS